MAKMDDGTIRLSVAFNDPDNSDSTHFYALTPDVASRLEAWKAEHAHATSEEFNNWVKNNGGVFDRDDGPAFVESNPDGSYCEAWYSQGIPHRTDGPAFVQTKPDGSHVEMWCREGQYFRTDGPAHVETKPDGSSKEVWYAQKPGEFHRTDGPAVIEKRADGSTVEMWYQNNKLHRTDGPASITTTPDGSRLETWYNQGNFITVQMHGSPSNNSGAPLLSS